MEYVYAALLVHNAGKPVTEESISSVLKAAGVKADATRAKALVAALEDVNIDEVLEKAPLTAFAAAPAAAAPAQAPAAAAEEEKKKKDEKEKEKEEDKEKAEESGIEGLSALFG